MLKLVTAPFNPVSFDIIMVLQDKLPTTVLIEGCHLLPALCTWIKVTALSLALPFAPCMISLVVDCEDVVNMSIMMYAHLCDFQE
jgi:hypothetical protein